MCEELRRVIDASCLQERWRGWGSRMLIMERRYKLSWSGKGDEIGGVGVIAKKLDEKLVKVKRMSDRIMAIELIFGEDVLRLISGFALHGGRHVKER